MLKDQLSKTSGLQCDNWLLGPERFSKRRSRPQSPGLFLVPSQYQFLTNSFPSHQPTEISFNWTLIQPKSVSDCSSHDSVCLSSHVLTLFVGDCSSNGKYHVMVGTDCWEKNSSLRQNILVLWHSFGNFAYLKYFANTWDALLTWGALLSLDALFHLMERTNERTNEWMNEWINEWMNEWMHEWMYENFINGSVYLAIN